LLVRASLFLIFETLAKTRTNTRKITVARNPFLILLVILTLSGLYVTYTLNLWGPILRMSNTMYNQAMEIAKEKLREFLESSDTGRQAMAMSAGRGNATSSDDISLHTLDGEGKRKIKIEEDDDEEDI
jgi:hypothetical protein